MPIRLRIQSHRSAVCDYNFHFEPVSEKSKQRMGIRNTKGQRPDLNQGPFVLEATAIPIVTQPLPPASSFSFTFAFLFRCVWPFSRKIINLRDLATDLVAHLRRFQNKVVNLFSAPARARF